MSKLRFCKISDGAEDPIKGSTFASGWDLTSPERHILIPHRTTVIGTGLVIQLPAGTYGKIETRSGHAIKVRMNG